MLSMFMNEMSNRVKFCVFLVLGSSLFLLLGCHPDKSKAFPPQMPEVGVVKLRFQELALTTELPGRTHPYRVAEVRPQVSGIILKRQFTEGSDVQVGQALYQIDAARYQAALESAAGELAKAEAHAKMCHLTVNRYKSLLGTHYVSEEDYDKAVAIAKQAEASVLAAKAFLEKTRIDLLFTNLSSPIAGRIGKSAVTEGALVTAGQPKALVSVQQLDPIYVDISQSSTDFLRLKRELANGFLKRRQDSIVVELILEDGSLYNQKGALQFSDVTVDETTGSITLRAIFPNPNQELLPGMFVRARLTEGVKEQALLAPQQAITRNARGQATALVVDKEGTVLLRTLATGQALGDHWLVTSGLEAGEQVVISGQLKIRPGMIVRAVEANEESKNRTIAAKPSTRTPASG